MLKGINQWCYPGGTPLEKVFEYSQHAGFDVVELNLNPAGDVGLTMDTTADEAREIVQLAATYNLKLRSLSTSLLWKFPLSSANEEIRAQGREVVIKQLELASVMGMDAILVVPGAVTNDVSYDDCYRRSQIELEKLIPYAEKHQVKIGVENVWNKFLLSPLEMKRYVDELKSAYIGVYFDVGNVLQFGFPEQWIRILKERIFKVHVKDFKTSAGTGAGFVPLLAGDVNWQDVRQALKDINYDDTIVAELSPYAVGPQHVADDTARHMDVILNS